MREYRRQKGIPKKVTTVISSIAVAIFVIFYVYDMLLGLFIGQDEKAKYCRDTEITR